MSICHRIAWILLRCLDVQQLPRSAVYPYWCHPTQMHGKARKYMFPSYTGWANSRFKINICETNQTFKCDSQSRVLVSPLFSWASFSAMACHCCGSVSLSFFVFQQWECWVYWIIFAFCRSARWALARRYAVDIEKLIICSFIGFYSWHLFVCVFRVLMKTDSN